MPVPKGYIEADVAFLDQLIALNSSTQKWFKDADTFAGFATYLAKIRQLSLQQMQDQKITDEDFEWLRLSYQELAELTTPRKLFGQPSSKLERGALIADIFTSEGGNPLYEAIGRPLLMALMVKDVNGSRIVLGPIFAHYEFYQADKLLKGDQRYADEDWQSAYDDLSQEQRMQAYGFAMRNLLEGLKTN